MGKRLTVCKMLTKRLAETKRMLNDISQYNNLRNIYGGIVDEEREAQYKINLEKDIDQLDYLINSLKTRNI